MDHFVNNLLLRNLSCCSLCHLRNRIDCLISVTLAHFFFVITSRCICCIVFFCHFFVDIIIGSALLFIDGTSFGPSLVQRLLLLILAVNEESSLFMFKDLSLIMSIPTCCTSWCKAFGHGWERGGRDAAYKSLNIMIASYLVEWGISTRKAHNNQDLVNGWEDVVDFEDASTLNLYSRDTSFSKVSRQWISQWFS